MNPSGGAGARRRPSLAVSAGTVVIGGDRPISVQSMTKTDTRDVVRTVAEIDRLAAAGCDLVRVAVPDAAAAGALAAIKAASRLPVIADIHFNHRLAMAALEAGVDKLRLNPGNLGSPDKVRLIARAAAERDVPVRVGANAGSLPSEALAKARGDAATALVASALEQVTLLEDAGHAKIVVSVKAHDLGVMTRAYRELAGRTRYPIHLGVTEAGAGIAGLVRSSLGIGALLLEGIGDTIRVSLTAPAEEEVLAGREILLAAGRRSGVTIVSCPTCGRTTVDMLALVTEVRLGLAGLDAPLKVALMGCEVNGPGEARDADIGVAVSGGRGLLFVEGRPVARLAREEIVPTLLKEVRRLAESRRGDASSAPA